ncbi:hypothetical protein [Komagataeibacter sp. FNDCF1]|uniref:hypothetical protein n=1 Tax=Komagataeibacter sp. FNDCF1 TaxID=2878681 RepID=UPI001E5B6106|nr:hypothetical protein [Komagataeibacter sp. FNDCF1]MCE2563204.1 hypothetical protein [Komagataeibacter sp. FNDCF1]
MTRRENGPGCGYAACPPQGRDAGRRRRLAGRVRIPVVLAGGTGRVLPMAAIPATAVPAVLGERGYRCDQNMRPRPSPLGVDYLEVTANLWLVWIFCIYILGRDKFCFFINIFILNNY